MVAREGKLVFFSHMVEKHFFYIILEIQIR